MRLLAGLPMYDFAWTAPALDEVWGWIGAFLRGRGVAAPPSLTRDMPLEALWRSTGLVLGQTCGYPYRHGLGDFVELIATPVYGFDGCEGASHCSFVVVRKDDARPGLEDFRGARAAINARDSNTGMNLFRAAIAPLADGRPFFSSVSITGAHVASLEQVARGAADIAAIDCVTFGFLAQGAPELVTGVRVLARTRSSPGLPFVASFTLPAELRGVAREAVLAALEEPSLKRAWGTSGIAGAKVLGPDAYGRIDELETGAVGLGYAELV